MKIAFDVDDTLLVPSVASGFPTDTPNYDTIALYKWFQAQGHYMIIWSGSGIDWAKTWAAKFGLTADEFPRKQKREDVDIAFDDCDVDLAKVNVKVKRLNNSVSRKDWNETKLNTNPMNIQDAIKVALEKGGYEGCSKIGINPNALSYQDITIIVLDRLFWQSLAKALNWENKTVVRRGTVIGNFVGGDKFLGDEMGFGMDYVNVEIYHALRYFELKLTGQPEEPFWTELLSTNKKI